MILETLAVGIFVANCYVLGCSRTGEGVVLDPGSQGDLILKKIQKHGLAVKAIVNTHGHLDHLMANARVQQGCGGAEVLLPQGDARLYQKPGFPLSLLAKRLPPPDRLLQEGDTIKFGDFSLEVLETPGHTPGSASFYLPTPYQGLLFSGDTLFAGSVGRTDFSGGSWEVMGESLLKKILPLPEETLIYPGHGPASTLRKEKRQNPFLRELLF